MTLSLFDIEPIPQLGRQELAPGAIVLRKFAAVAAENLIAAIGEVSAQAPFRNMITPGGFRMSVAMTNCGTVGWVSERSGYRYDPIDPETGRHWPAMPEAFRQLAVNAAAELGFSNFNPDVCLINRYEPGAKLSLHQDKDEKDQRQPIVSVSLGLPCVFLFGGERRDDRPQRILLEHGDVVVWGGPSRLNYHGVMPLKPGRHAMTGEYRFNLTFRHAF
jgi:alkylated DNA repair protein (DNA oxidative demethylase)